MGYDIARKEKDIQLSILHYLRNIGADGGKTKTMGVKRGKAFCFDPYTFRGKADLEAFYKGIMYCIEVKRPGQKLSEAQERYKDLFHKPPDRIFIKATCVDDVYKVMQPELAYPLK